MDHREMVALIHDGVAERGGVWADLGAGTGNFTWALRDLLDSAATIYAVDRDGKAIAAQRTRAAHATNGATIVPVQADFTQRLRVPPLDGVLMANALHFVRDQETMLRQIVHLIKPGGRLLLVEYELQTTQRWVPFPVPFARFQALAAATGLTMPHLVGTRRSPRTGIALYAAVATKGA
jgi:ubiquinone/menaquinone biosynthesis C-methylase UbiE